MAKTLSYQVIEDNGGGLHLAVFDEHDQCIYYASGLEYQDPTDVQDNLAALRAGDDPRDGWEVNLPDGYTPQQLYDELTGYDPATWRIIADDAGVYPERMGAAGQRAFGLND